MPRAFTDLLGVASSIGRERNWLFEGVIEGNPIAVFAGPEKSAKSWAMLDAAVCAVTGQAWLGEFPCKRTGPAIYLDAEYGEQEFVRRLARVCRARGLDLKDVAAPAGSEVGGNYLHHLYSTGVEFTADPENEGVRWLVERVLKIKPALVIVDPWRNHLPGDENSTVDTLAALEIVARIRDATGATIILPHHLNKSGFQSGSRALMGRADLLFEGTDTDEPKYSTRGRTIRFADPIKKRFSIVVEHTDDLDDTVATSSVGLVWEKPGEKTSKGDKRGPVDRVLDFLAANKGRDYTTKQLSDELSLSWKMTDEALSAGLMLKRVSKGGKVVRGQERVTWQYKPSADDVLAGLKLQGEEG